MAVFSSSSLLSLTTNKELILSVRKLVSQSIHSLIGTPDFLDICVKGSQLLYNLFPACERLFFESEYLLSKPVTVITLQVAVKMGI